MFRSKSHRSSVRVTSCGLLALGLSFLGDCATQTASKASTPSGPSSHGPHDGGLWGYADLHVHPASHLAFGSAGGMGGAMWGYPGGAFNDADPTRRGSKEASRSRCLCARRAGKPVIPVESHAAEGFPQSSRQACAARSQTAMRVSAYLAHPASVASLKRSCSWTETTHASTDARIA
jgi:hypothetical protein